MSSYQGYCVEHNGDCWQSVFPSYEAEKSQLHVTVDDAVDYMVNECGVVFDAIHHPLPVIYTETLCTPFCVLIVDSKDKVHAEWWKGD